MGGVGKSSGVSTRQLTSGGTSQIVRPEILTVDLEALSDAYIAAGRTKAPGILDDDAKDFLAWGVRLQDRYSREDEYIKKVASENGMTINELKRKSEPIFKNEMSEKNVDIGLRIGPDALTKVLQSGRFKTQFETNSSGGTFDKSLRSSFERAIMGYHKNTIGLMRPIYGMTAPKGKFPEGDDSNYGRLYVVLKPYVRKRTSVTRDDSLDARLIPSSINSPRWYSVRPSDWQSIAKTGKLNSDSYFYNEIQVHNGLRASDIQEVRIQKGTRIPKQLREQLTQSGISIVTLSK